MAVRKITMGDKENTAAGVSEVQMHTQEGAQAQDPGVTELATAFVGLGVLVTMGNAGVARELKEQKS